MTRDIDELRLPADRRYAAEHAWALIGADGTVTVGMSDYAQDQLGEVEWFSLPDVGETVGKDSSLAQAESAKSVSDVFCPCSGIVVEVNQELGAKPTLANEDPYGEGWIARIQPSDPAQLDTLMDASTYRAHLAAGRI